MRSDCSKHFWMALRADDRSRILDASRCARAKSRTLAAAAIFTALELIILLASAPTIWSTTFARMSLEQLSTAAPLIVRARCQGSIVVTERAEIWTITSFEVREVWKGSAPQTVRVRLLGGRTAQYTSHVEGIPRFQAGEDVVLFLTPSRAGNYSVTSWEQGTFRIHRGASDVAAVVTQDTAAFSPHEFSASAGARKKDDGRVRGLALDEFRRRVLDSIRRHP